MKMNISYRNTEASDALKARIAKKLGKMDKFFDDDLEAQVRLAQERGGRNIVEITINADGTMLRAEEVSGDMYTSVDKAADKLERQIARYRRRFAQRLREGALEALEVAEEPQEHEAELVRVKRFALKPMAVEDAIAQMDMLGHSFFLFLNDATGGACVVYRRNDGDIGMLEPENA